jgi:hypothetical protein
VIGKWAIYKTWWQPSRIELESIEEDDEDQIEKKERI